MIQSKSSLPLNKLVFIQSAIILLTPLYCYHVAVSNGEAPPFPHTTITRTACNYPQSIIFRWTMTSAGCFVSLLYFVIYKWFKSEAKRIQYPYSIQEYTYWPAQLSVIGYMITMGTIDDAGTITAHDIGAVVYFVSFFLVVVNLTIVAYKMRRWDTSFLTPNSYRLKIIITIYLVALWVYCIVGLITENLSQDDVYVVIVEWNSVYVCMGWILSFGWDWKHTYITLKRH